MSQATYELLDKFQYAHKKDQVDASFIELEAPGFDQMKDFVTIKQALLAAVREITDTPDDTAEAAEDAKESGGLDGATILSMLYMGKADAATAMSAAKRLLTNGVASVEGVETLTAPLLRKMSMRDFEGLVGTYLANFIMPSLVDGV